MAAGARWPTSTSPVCIPPERCSQPVVTSSVWLLSVVVATRTSRPRVVSTTVYSTGLDREARGEGVPDRQRLAGCRRGLGGVPLALIHAVLTHKSDLRDQQVRRRVTERSMPPL